MGTVEASTGTTPIENAKLSGGMRPAAAICAVPAGTAALLQCAAQQRLKNFSRTLPFNLNFPQKMAGKLNAIRNAAFIRPRF
jgi:hypothetical protein